MTATFYAGAFELQRRGGAVVTGQLGYVITLASLAIGVLVFGERVPPSTWIGAGLAILGVLLVLGGGPQGPWGVASQPRTVQASIARSAP